MKLFWTVVLIALCMTLPAIAKETRIVLESFINDQPVKLGIDTGAEIPVLFRQTANRLNLTITEPPDDMKAEPGRVIIAKTEECRFQSKDGGAKGTFRFAVIDIPGSLDIKVDGLLGWKILKQAMLVIDPSSRSAGIHDTLEFNKSEWKCLEFRKDIDLLVARTSSDDIKQDYLLIDTGDFAGFTVRKELWNQLAGDRTGSNTTLSATYTPGIGLAVDKVKWIQDINFGGLQLREIPVQTGLEANVWLAKEGIDGILGMWGLSCYQWIVDGSAGKIYFKPNDLIRISQMYEYNRLGAVFVPEDLQTTNALIAHVVKGGPAYRAGIRDGDELLKIGSLDATKWRTNPNVMPLSQYWEKPAGTIIELVLLRNGEKKNIAVRLEEIFKSTVVNNLSKKRR